MHFKRFVPIIPWILAIATIAQAQSSVFEYQPAKVEPGAVYHYVKTEKDGTNPENISIYVTAADRLEVFKFHEPGTRAGLVIANLDYKLFQVKSLQSYTVTTSADKTLVASLDYDPTKKITHVVVTAQADKPETTEIGFVPFHVYNFDLTSLNMMMRHLKNPEGAFKIGIADPNFSEEGPLFIYRGEVDVKFAGDEKHDGVDCRKYDINGAGVENRGGSIWVRKDGEYFQEVLMDLPDNPNWQSFRLSLKKKEHWSPGEWQKFIQAHFESGERIPPQ